MGLFDKIKQTVERHPVKWGIFGYVFGTFPMWLSSIWGFFSSEPLFQWLQSKGLKMPSSSITWITAPIGLMLLGYIALVSHQKRKQKSVPGLIEEMRKKETIQQAANDKKNDPVKEQQSKVLNDDMMGLLSRLQSLEGSDGNYFFSYQEYTETQKLIDTAYENLRTIDAAVAAQFYAAGFALDFRPDYFKISKDIPPDEYEAVCRYIDWETHIKFVRAHVDELREILKNRSKNP